MELQCVWKLLSAIVQLGPKESPRLILAAMRLAWELNLDVREQDNRVVEI